MSVNWTVEHHPENPRKPWWVVGLGDWTNPKTGQPVKRWCFDYSTEEAANKARPMREAEYKAFEVEQV